MPKLTDPQILKVSGRIDKKYDIRNLFYHLKIEKHKVNAIFQDNKDDIGESVHKLFDEWLKNQKDRREAYRTLWNALIEVNLSSIAHKVLKKPPAAEVNAESPQKGKPTILSSGALLQ